MFAPAEEASKAVLEWLVASGINASQIMHYENKGWLGVDMPASKAEDLFRAEYYEHEHAKDGSIRVGCDE